MESIDIIMRLIILPLYSYNIWATSLDYLLSSWVNKEKNQSNIKCTKQVGARDWLMTLLSRLCFYLWWVIYTDPHYVLLPDHDLLSQSVGNLLIMAAHNHLTRQQGLALIDSVLRCIIHMEWEPVGEFVSASAPYNYAYTCSFSEKLIFLQNTVGLLCKGFKQVWEML